MTLPENRQAGAEIEITDEMLKAGVLEDRRHGWADIGDEDDRIRSIFAAMWSARPANSVR